MKGKITLFIAILGLIAILAASCGVKKPSEPSESSAPTVELIA